MTVSAAARQALPEKLRVAVSTVRRTEAGLGPVRGYSENVWKVQRALEQAGIQFIDESGGGGGGDVRLRDRELRYGSRLPPNRFRRRRLVSIDRTNNAAFMMVICEALSCAPELLIVGSRQQRKAMIVRDRPELSLSRQCRLLSIGRSSFYYTAKGESPENLALTHRRIKAPGIAMCRYAMSTFQRIVPPFVIA